MNNNLFLEFIANRNFHAETNHEGLQSFLRKGFIPLMKMGHEFDRELLNQVELLGAFYLFLTSNNIHLLLLYLLFGSMHDV